ncbi:MAG: nucleotide pyrophosphohydrolase [Nitriliruptoraceae bacterium]
MNDDPIAELQTKLRSFAKARDWEQFHTPKNLAMALSGEVGELVEIFQWLTPNQADHVMQGQRSADVEDELADVFIYLLRLADVLGIDLARAAHAKIGRNELRYPAQPGTEPAEAGARDPS